MSEEEFEAWQHQHACDGNFGGSSPSMELEAAKRFGEEVKITSDVISSRILMETLNPMVLFGINMVFVTCVTKIKNCTNPQKNMNNGKKQKSTKNGTTVISQGQQIVIVL